MDSPDFKPDSPAASSVKRSVFAIHIAPLKQPLTVQGRKLHIALAQMAGEQFQRLTLEQRTTIDDALRAYIAGLRAGKRPAKPPMLLQPQFYASLTELAHAVGYNPTEARALMPYLTSLTHTPVRFNSLRHKAASGEKELFADELEVHTTLLSSAVRTGRGEISWAYDPKILGIMVEPRTYAMLNLELIRNARTYTALALYENCRRFVAVGRTGTYPLKRWQELLSENASRPTWENAYEFMRRVKKAIHELAATEGCDIVIEPKRQRVPDLGVCLQFVVKPLEQAKLTFGMPVPPNRALAKALRDLGFTEREVTTMFDVRSEEYLENKLAMLDKTRARQPEAVKDAKAWLGAAIERDFRDETVERELDLERARARQARAKQLAQAKAAFAVYQAQQLRTRFSEAGDDVRARWEVEFAESAAGLAASKLPSKAKEASFFGWLAGQSHELFIEDEEREFGAYALSYGAAKRASSKP